MSKRNLKQAAGADGDPATVSSESQPMQLAAPPSSEAPSARASHFAQAESKARPKAESFVKARSSGEAHIGLDGQEASGSDVVTGAAAPSFVSGGMAPSPGGRGKPENIEFHGLVDLRQNRNHPPPRSRPYRWLTPTAFIMLPTLLAALYLGLVASPRYTARALLSVKSTNTVEPIAALGLGGLGIGSGGADQDSRMLAAYLTSSDLFVRLDGMTKVIDHWRSPERDWLFRLADKPSAETAFEHYLSRSTVRLDPDSGFILFEIQAYDPAYALNLAEAVLKQAENAVNELGHILTKDRLSTFDKELLSAEQEMRAAAQALLAFQNESQVPDAKGSIEALSALLANIAASEAQARAELAALLATQGENNPMVATARARIDAMNQQRNELSAKLVHADGIGKLALRQAELQAELQLRAQAHQATLAAREQARIELSHKLKQLIVIDPPRRPEDASAPRVLYLTLTVLVVSALAYAIVALLLATVREHRD